MGSAKEVELKLIFTFFRPYHLQVTILQGYSHAIVGIASSSQITRSFFFLSPPCFFSLITVLFITVFTISNLSINGSSFLLANPYILLFFVVVFFFFINGFGTWGPVDLAWKRFLLLFSKSKFRIDSETRLVTWDFSGFSVGIIFDVEVG